MEIALGVLSIILIAGGIIFSILPPIPGPLLTYGALICAHHLSDDTTVDTSSFIIWGVIGGIILVADYVLPVAATKKFGGTKYGIIGGIVGTIVGVVLPIPFGIILGPLLGAIIGDLYGGSAIKAAFKSGFGSFVGFLLATALKLIYAIVLGVVIAIKVGGFTLSFLSDLF